MRSLALGCALALVSPAVAAARLRCVRLDGPWNASTLEILRADATCAFEMDLAWAGAGEAILVEAGVATLVLGDVDADAVAAACDFLQRAAEPDLLGLVATDVYGAKRGARPSTGVRPKRASAVVRVPETNSICLDDASRRREDASRGRDDASQSRDDDSRGRDCVL
jgi:hypothetical protein